MIKRFIIYASLMILITPNIVEAGYCIQVSSVNKIDQKYILKKAKNKIFQDKPDVRVEKLGHYLTLRVGDFTNTREALPTLREIQRIYPDAFVRKCAQHPENIVYSTNRQSSNIFDEIEQKQEKQYKNMKSIDLPPNYIYEDTLPIKSE